MTAELLTPEFFAPIAGYLLLLAAITVYSVRAGMQADAHPAAERVGVDETDQSDQSDQADQANRSYFLAGRGVSSWLAFLSVVATETSVATILVFPQVGFQSGGFALIWLCFGYIAGRWLVARYYLEPIYSRHRLSMYATVSASRAASRALSLAYLLAKDVSSGVRFYLGGLAFAKLLGVGIVPAILFIALIAGAYSLAGGLRAVILTDQLQGYIILFMGVFLVVSLGTGLDFAAAAAPAFINTEFSLFNAQFFPVLFLGGAVLSIGSHGADQDMLQRVLATRSLSAARRAVVLSGVGATVVITIYLAVGYLLGVGAGDGQLSGIGKDTPLVDYINVLKNPWLSGAFAVLLVAAAMSTLDSAMHSTGAIWKSILVSDHPTGAARSDAGNRVRIYSLLSLAILTGAALVFVSASGFRNFLDLAMSFMNYVNGGLIGVFTLFVWHRRALGLPAIVAALLAGFITTLLANTSLVFEARPGWTYTTIAAGALAFAVAWVADRYAGDQAN